MKACNKATIHFLLALFLAGCSNTKTIIPFTSTPVIAMSIPTAEPVVIAPGITASPSPVPLLTLEKSTQQFTARETFQAGFGDLDGDLDALIACHQFVTPSRVYLNDGTGIMLDTGQDLGDKSISANEVNLLDLNGDGHMDVHVMYFAPNGLPDKVYLNDGHTNFMDSGLMLDEEPIA